MFSVIKLPDETVPANKLEAAGLMLSKKENQVPVKKLTKLDIL
jgi:hypothetical protein